MTVLEFLDKKGWRYTLHNKEATLEECPFCKAKNRFNVNIETGQYICNRQNSCGAKGVFKLNEEKQKKVKLISPDGFDTLSNSQLAYFKSRGISKETTKKARVLSRQGALCFFYTNSDGRAIGVKYRTIPREGEKKKIWSAKDSEMLLLNWDKVPKSSKKLYITEGEIDMLSLLEIGVDNVVSVPNGTKSQEWIEKQYKWLEKFEEIVLCLDNDTAGQTAIKEISERLSDMKCTLKTLDLIFYKDINEVLQDENGEDKLRNILKNNEKEIDLSVVVSITSIQAENDEDAIDWGDKNFNLMTGGLRYGEVFVFTGNSGCGKSTFINNLMANLLGKGHKIYTHQGEFAPGVFKNNLYKVLCRPQQIETYKNELKNKVYGKISTIVEQKIDEWLEDRLIIHGSQVPKKNELIKTIEQMYKRNGIKIVFIDNLMTIELDKEDKYEEQKQLFIELQALAKKYNLFIGIVAHPKKNNLPLNEVDQYVVHGASEIVNLANYAIYFKRLNENEVNTLKEIGVIASVGGVTLKDRKFGDVGNIKYWNYEIKTGRFLTSDEQEKGLNKKYGWEDYDKTIFEQEFPF